MMQFNQWIIIKRWKPILEEYEKIQNKVSPRSFKLVKDLKRTGDGSLFLFTILKPLYYKAFKKIFSHRFYTFSPYIGKHCKF